MSSLQRYAVYAAALVAVQIAVLWSFGQPPFAASGHLMLWVNDPFSPDTSQQFADWYSFSHIVHGILFYGLTHLIAPRLPLGARLLIAMGIEISWEIAENTPFVINAYRKQALAVGYTGDSIFNSVMDTLMMGLGFFLAARLPVRGTIALALALELFAGVMIRDNLTLNILNFVAPMDSIHGWQAGARAATSNH
jgi:hypothetical protein